MREREMCWIMLARTGTCRYRLGGIDWEFGHEIGRIAGRVGFETWLEV